MNPESITTTITTTTTGPASRLHDFALRAMLVAGIGWLSGPAGAGLLEDVLERTWVVDLCQAYEKDGKQCSVAGGDGIVYPGNSDYFYVREFKQNQQDGDAVFVFYDDSEDRLYAFDVSEIQVDQPERSVIVDFYDQPTSAEPGRDKRITFHWIQGRAQPSKACPEQLRKLYEKHVPPDKLPGPDRLQATCIRRPLVYWVITDRPDETGEQTATDSGGSTAPALFLSPPGDSQGTAGGGL